MFISTHRPQSIIVTASLPHDWPHYLSPSFTVSTPNLRGNHVCACALGGLQNFYHHHHHRLISFVRCIVHLHFFTFNSAPQGPNLVPVVATAAADVHWNISTHR